jgi:ATP-binding cassette, subfamily B, bacterial PglK
MCVTHGTVRRTRLKVLAKPHHRSCKQSNPPLNTPRLELLMIRKHSRASSQGHRSLLQLLSRLSPQRRRQLLLLSLLSLAAAVAEVGNLGALLSFLKLLAAPHQGVQSLGFLGSGLSHWDERSLRLLFGSSVLAMVVISSSLRLLTIHNSLKLTALITRDIGKQVFEAVLNRPYPWHLWHNSSQTLSLVTQDVNQVMSILDDQLALLINGMVVLVLGGSLIAFAPGVMLTISLLLGGCYLLVYRLTRATLAADGAIRREHYQATTQTIQEGLGGIRDILLDHSQPLYVREFDQHNSGFRMAIYRIFFKVKAPRYILEGAVLLIIVGVAFWQALQGKEFAQMVPLLGTLALGSYRLLQPLQQCFSAFASLKSNEASLKKLLPYLEPAQTLLEPFLPSGQITLTPEIRLEALWFRYRKENDWVLRDLSLCIPSGSRVGFVGSTGSGKSTTIDLILGLLTPQQGEVQVGGQSLSDPAILRAWQAQIAHVPQQIYLSDASFAENIAFGVSPDAIDGARVRQAAQQACITELIEAQPHGYEERVGERGIRLSGGQRQRVGIARALYKQAQVIVLDEATSALDNLTEQQVLSALSVLGREITVIMIAHRLTTVQDCDCIFHLEQGQLVAQGRYDELLQRSDAFRSLAKRQTADVKHNL